MGTLGTLAHPDFFDLPGNFWEIEFFDFFFSEKKSLVEDPQYRRPELTLKVSKLPGGK